MATVVVTVTDTKYLPYLRQKDRTWNPAKFVFNSDYKKSKKTILNFHGY